jgi:hypothetical protein
MTTYVVGKVSAVLILLDVIAVYLYCLLIRGVYPPSHPWSGFALLLLSVVLIRAVPSRFSRVSVALAMLSAGLWTVSAIVRG